MFELAGQPLRQAKLWTFDGSTDGFTAAKSQLSLADDKGLHVRVVDPPLRSPRDLEIEGWSYSLVLVRLTRLKRGKTWDGALYYTTETHPESVQFLAKPISGADPAIHETSILVYDMTRLTVGGEDWRNSIIDQIRLDLEDQPGGEFLIHQVAIAASSNAPALLAPSLR
ncbi:MAG: hypothetical protein Q8Q88_19550 [Phenylobacterium sp.]|uniref:hypothetical protein n=1 Tax=Phenylobacterium sp. TaxID=1871053 RepID=UPI002734BCB4|nr:hypothetical protein [Phenylobacterium sp.]MDP3749237.1 hypothetical protein [Phenylobacterium sp.]